MKKFFKTLDKIIRSILVFPYTLILAVAWGILTMIGSLLCMPCEVIRQIWEEEPNE